MSTIKLDGRPTASSNRLTASGVSLVVPSNTSVHSAQSTGSSYASDLSLSPSGTLVPQTEHPRPSYRVVDSSEPGAHKVTFTVTVSVAFPVGPEDKEESVSKSSTSAHAKLGKKVIEAPRNQRYLHCEYLVFPGDSTPVQTDVVLYGRLAAKIFTDQLDSKIVQAWSQDDVTWVSWSSSHTVTVTESLLNSLITHSVVIKLWDNKEKCSTRAKFDRAKAFKLPHDKPSDDVYGGTGVRPIVLRQCDSYQSQQPKRFASEASEMKENQPPNKLPYLLSVASAAGAFDPKIQHLMDVLRKRSQTSMIVPSFHSFLQLSAENFGATDGSAMKLSRRSVKIARTTSKMSSHSNVSKKSGADKTKHGNKEEVDKPTSQITLHFAQLFAGPTTVTDRLSTPTDTVKDSFASVTLSERLMSRAQAEKLNPIVVHVHAATQMPSTPVPFGQLHLRCQPAYAKYQVMDLPIHVCPGLPQDKNLYWDDINVILAGTKDKSEIKEFIGGRPFEIEVHDRDRRTYKYEEAGTLFGEEADDEQLGSSSASNKTTLLGSNKVWDSYGVARFDLSDLMLGQTVLELQAPILSCPLPEKSVTSPAIGPDGQLIAPPGVTEGPIEPPLRGGAYIESDAVLKIRVSLAYPLSTPAELAQHALSQSSAACPFGRIVYIFPFNNANFLSQLTSQVAAINAKSLQLESLPQHDLETALATYKLTSEQQQSVDLDIITGFRVVDPNNFHLIVLEGLRAGAITELTDNVCAADKDVTVLYHSNLGFSKRLYGSFDVDLFCVLLRDSLSSILRNPLIYVRDVVPCFKGLVKLQQLNQTRKLRDAVRNDLFPTAEDIVSMGREFGVPIEPNHFIAMELPAEKAADELQQSEAFRESWPETGVQSNTDDKCQTQPISAEPADIVTFHKNEFDAEQRAAEARDVIYRNKVNVSNLSEHMRLQRSVTCPATMMIEGKTTDEAMDKLRRFLWETDPGHLYTFCSEFHHSMTLPKNTLRATLKEHARKSREEWLTSAGWINRGALTSDIINQHPKRPSSAKIEDLAVPLEELYDTSSDDLLLRDPFPWDYRKIDLDIWTKPPEFRKVEKMSESEIQLNGADLQRRAEEKKRARKLRMPRVEGARTHRRSISTELQERGSLASNQLDRLRGVLKDEPNRFILRSHPPADVPALSVVHHPSVDAVMRESGIEMPPVMLPHSYPKGLTAGPRRHRSIQIPGNHVPLADYKRKDFARMNGSDFNVYHKERPKYCSRRIRPLSKDESTEYRSLWRCGQPPRLLKPGDRCVPAFNCTGEPSEISTIAAL